MTSENREGPPSLDSVVERLCKVEKRLAQLEGKTDGYICAGCGNHRPGDWYFYIAYNSETHEEVRNLCAVCIRGGHARVQGSPWKHNGPYYQET